MPNDPDDALPITDEELGDLFTFKRDPTAIVEGEGVTTAWALGWFPKDEWAKAIVEWPELLDTMPADHVAYSKRIEGHLKAAAARGEPGSPDVSPLSVEALFEEFGDDAGDMRSRATMSAGVARAGQAIRWPPGRNDACWCGSATKYKRCCGPVLPD